MGTPLALGSQKRATASTPARLAAFWRGSPQGPCRLARTGRLRTGVRLCFLYVAGLKSPIPRRPVSPLPPQPGPGAPGTQLSAAGRPPQAGQTETHIHRAQVASVPVAVTSCSSQSAFYRVAHRTS